MKIALVNPHIFMWDKILRDSIFAPGKLSIDLANGLVDRGHDVTLFTTGPIKTRAKVEPVNLSGINSELKKRDQSLIELIKEDLPTFNKLFKIIEYEILSKSFSKANKFDLIHVFITNGPEGPIFSKQIKKTPVIFTLHDPFKFNFPNQEVFDLIKNVKFTAMSNNQKSHVSGLNVIETIYHGIDIKKFKFNNNPKKYFLSYGRIIEPKGVHHAINACLKTGNKLKISGLHYEGHGGDNYWSTKIKKFVDDKQIFFEGFIKKQKRKNELLGNAEALLFPIEWEEPFGLVIIEANACGTPVIAFNQGSVPEIVKDGINGFIVENESEMMEAMKKIHQINRKECREYVKENFSLERMIDGYEKVYLKIIKK